MTEDRFQLAFADVMKLDGCMYPWPRLALHLIGMAKYVHWKYPVCSELVAKMGFEAGLRKQWWGISPDNLADQWRESKHYDIIAEEVLGEGISGSTAVADSVDVNQSCLVDV